MKLSKRRFKKNQISIFLKQSKKLSNPYVNIHYHSTDTPQYAFICPKRLGNAVKRNKMKRQLKMAFMNIYHSINPSCSFVFIAKKDFCSTTFPNLMNMVLLSLKKRDLIQ